MIEDIEKAVDAGAYRAALALALMIPDVCGQIAYPDTTSVGNRYRRWFNKYVKKYYPKTKIHEYFGINTFDGYMCYKLRCAYLHSGNSILQDMDYLQTIDFFICEDDTDIDFLGDKGQIVYEVDDRIVKSTHMRLNIKKLCLVMCAAGRQFFSDINDVNVLKPFDINIYDAEEEIPNGY